MAEKKEKKIRIALAVALVVQVFWILSLSGITGDGVVAEIVVLISLAGTIAAYIMGGGVGMAFKAAWAISKKIGWIGWFFAPFPTDIFLGITLTLAGVLMFPLMLLILPLVFVLISYKQNRMNRKYAELFLQNV